MANSVVQSLLRTGEVVRGWLGISMRPIPMEAAQEAGLEGQGVLILDVSEGSPAAVAGLLQGDMITALNGREVTNTSQLQNAVARRTPGTVVRMTVLRDGRDRDVPVTLGERPPLGELQLAQIGAQPSETMGLIVQELTPERAEELDIRSRTGVEVLVVVPDGFADDVGIKQGDVIIGLDRQPIESLDDFRRATEQLDLDNPVHIRLQRGRATFSVEIE
jgi:serine protease Do